jgi:hypothetical protein
LKATLPFTLWTEWEIPYQISDRLDIYYFEPGSID